MLRYIFVFAALGIWEPASGATEKKAPVTGFADIHVHMFSEYAFGGAWLHGQVEGEIAKALAGCEAHSDPFELAGNHAEIKIPFISHLIGKTIGSRGDTGSHPERSSGYPGFSGWPRWDTIAHQQVWQGHLKLAHERGLNLIVVSMVNFEPLCELMLEKNKKYKDCSDEAALERQLDAVEQFEKNHSWFKIVRSPEEARRAIREGKLAVILSIEESRIFGSAPWRPQFESAWSRGVRTLQLAHQLNNRFAGAAIHNTIFRLFQWYSDYKAHARGLDVLMPWKFGFKTSLAEDGLTRLNQQGLTEEGRDLAREMIRRGMPIDISHLSEQTVKDLRPITEASGNFPVYISHGHFREMMDDGKFSIYEKSSSSWVLQYILDSNGIFGLRTGPEKTKAHPDSVIPNDCQGSSKSFAQTYQFGVKKQIPIAFASDLNGFIQQTRPRFGNRDETCGAETDRGIRELQQKSQGRMLNTRFDHSGLGDVSQISDLLLDLKNHGMDTTPLENSAETYLRMWDRAVALSKQKI